jgi:hypothetical protein
MTPRSEGRGQATISFFRPDAAVFILLGALALLWPLLWTGGLPFMMVDSAIYADQGERIWSVVHGMIASTQSVPQDPGVSGVAADPGVAASLSGQADSDDTVRSIPYAAFVGAFLPIGAGAVLYVQAVLVMATLYAAVAPTMRRLPWWLLAGICGLVLVVTPLPTMASFLMPDIFGAVIVLFAIRVVLGLGALYPLSRAILIAIALLAVTFHYGNVPFAVVLLGVAALLQANRRQALRSLAVVAGGIAVFAVGLNMVIGLVAFEGASAAPNRAPIVLARSIEDGPARWVLEEDCASPAPRYALCEYWGTDIPTNVGAALWDEGGMDRAPPELYARIRAQEIALLAEGFRSYPLHQVGAFLGNALDQVLVVDTDYAFPAVFRVRDDGRRSVEIVENTAITGLYPFLNAAHAVSYFAGIAILVAMILIPGHPAQRRVAIVVLSGLAINALIFGGLSAPVARYQARIAWLALTVALFALADRWAIRGGSAAVPERRRLEG